ncbi:cytochrome oxidase c assembly-domain-containing protein [Apiospora arundinis]
MAKIGSPRSVAEATLFTSNTPHANIKKAANSATPAPSSPAATAAASAPSNATPTMSSTRSSAAASSSRSAPAPRRPLQTPGTMPLGNRPAAPETLDEKVRRLRAAHLAAKNHDVSKLDKVIGGTRRYMDAAHRFTVMGLIGFSGLALVVTVYATVDMMMYNRKRRNEFFAMQQTLQSDSLDAARLAYMTGKATDEQINMVEEATERAKQAGVPLPKLLNPAKTASVTDEAAASYATATADRTVWPGESMQGASMSGAEEEPKKKGLTNWLFSGLKKEDTAAGSDGSSLNFKNEETAASGRSSAVMRALDEQKDNVKAALDTERDNQRKGGPLDQLGLAPQEKPQKKGWFW